jgi:hypothetical protein
MTYIWIICLLLILHLALHVLLHMLHQQELTKLDKIWIKMVLK